MNEKISLKEFLTPKIKTQFKGTIRINKSLIPSRYIYKEDYTGFVNGYNPLYETGINSLKSNGYIELLDTINKWVLKEYIYENEKYVFITTDEEEKKTPLLTIDNKLKNQLTAEEETKKVREYIKHIKAIKKNEHN